MQHQAFWIDHLQRTRTAPTEWIYWLAYDDEVRERGISAITDDQGNWPLRLDTVYFGPWALRHEQPDRLWHGDPTEELESWTSFPAEGPTRLPVLEWIRQQLVQPTYMQMSGSVSPLRNFISLEGGSPRQEGSHADRDGDGGKPPHPGSRGVPTTRCHRLRPTQLRPSGIWQAGPRRGPAPACVDDSLLHGQSSSHVTLGDIVVNAGLQRGLAALGKSASPGRGVASSRSCLTLMLGSRD